MNVLGKRGRERRKRKMNMKSINSCETNEHVSTISFTKISGEERISDLPSWLSAADKGHEENKNTTIARVIKMACKSTLHMVILT